MITDMHLHTRLSKDAPDYKENNALGYLKKAHNLGIKYIAVTDHNEVVPEKDAEDISADTRLCYEDVKEAQKYEESAKMGVTLLFGTELGQMTRDFDKAEKILAGYPFDFVIGSLHLAHDGRDFYGMNYEALDNAEFLKVLEKYVAELYEIAEKGDFDSLAHCTYPFRYLERNGKMPDLCENPYKYFPLYKDVFKKLIERGKALEINTSDIKRGGRLLPDFPLVKLYRKLGGEMITIGSDSHDAEFLGSGVDKAEMLVKELGFKGVTVFIKRKPFVCEF